ncbi:abortive phage infection protein [Streptomyces physcomitrii]|uniref:Abortive phage infection protein n=1 Tax=Streptomyces physcomitrii TaxID=2724184 RepID=A0ABX1H4V7_9ACTN|nr:abortive phage infection protein [Streptomyces physcomitrii]NKI42284.1 abortive phage infection protein [Streptomyces physcomitrii]
MRGRKISRGQFLTGAAAVGIAGTAGGILTGRGTHRAEATEPGQAARRGHRGLTYRGVGYEVADGETPHTGWNAARMRKDLRVIRRDLGANSVSVFGDGVDRLKATSTQAAEEGLHVWLQPRLADRPHKEILEHLAETGRHAERLRKQGAAVHLSVGCEFVLFVPGIVPGANALERIENLTQGNFDPVMMRKRLRAFIAKSAKTARSVFGGRITYGAAEGDEVDWSLFDLVSVNYYAYFPHRADHVRELRTYQRWGKPVVVSEFGTCTYRGAPEKGGMGWDAVDYEKEPPEIISGLVRSERTQAAYLADLLDIFESMNLYAALAYQFVTPDAPHRTERRYDLDMASYSLVKPLWQSKDEPGREWHWEPKESFRAVAGHFGRA